MSLTCDAVHSYAETPAIENSGQQSFVTYTVSAPVTSVVNNNDINSNNSNNSSSTTATTDNTATNVVVTAAQEVSMPPANPAVSYSFAPMQVQANGTNVPLQQPHPMAAYNYNGVMQQQPMPQYYQVPYYYAIQGQQQNGAQAAPLAPGFAPHYGQHVVIPITAANAHLYGFAPPGALQAPVVQTVQPPPPVAVGDTPPDSPIDLSPPQVVRSSPSSDDAPGASDSYRKSRKELSKKSSYNAKWSLKGFGSWLASRSFHRDPSKLGVSLLIRILPHFYRTFSKKKSSRSGLDDDQSGSYSPSSMFNVRAMINSYLKKHHPSDIDIVEGDAFKGANKAFEERIFKIKNYKAGKETSSFAEDVGIIAEDLELLQTTGVFRIDDPEALLSKVWFDLTIFLQPSAPAEEWTTQNLMLIFDEGIERFYITWNTPDKKGEEYRMYETKDTACVVQALITYINKLTVKNGKLFQKMCVGAKSQQSSRWYGPETVGKEEMDKMMLQISDRALLSKMYSNKAVSLTDVNPEINKMYVPWRSIVPGSGCKQQNLHDVYVLRHPVPLSPESQ